MLTDDLAEIERRAERATPGPWEARDGQLLAAAGSDDMDTVLSCCNVDDYTLDFIAAARSDVPALVAEVQRLRGEIYDAVYGPYAWTEERDGMMLVPVDVMDALRRALEGDA